MPIWGVVNQKGGVGKTTTAVNLAAGLSVKGKRTLLVDCDPQGNATTGLGVDKTTLIASLAEVLIEASEPGNHPTVLEDATIKLSETFHIVPASTNLAGIEATLANAIGKESLLKDILIPAKSNYDWIVIDSPPSLGLMTINVLTASEFVLVPMQCEFYSLEGLSQLLKTIQAVQRRINPALKIGKVLLTMVDPRSRSSQQVVDEVSAYFGEALAKTVIPRNVRLSEAPSFGIPAISKFPTSKGAEAYRQLVEEVLA